MLRSRTRMLAFAASPVCFGMAAIIPELLPMLYGSDFSDASLAAAILVCGAGIGATVSVPAAFTIGLGRSDFAFLSDISGAILSVVLGSCSCRVSASWARRFAGAPCSFSSSS